MHLFPFFFTPPPPKYTVTKAVGRISIVDRLWLRLKKSYKNLVQVLHRWFTPSGEASPADGVSLMQRTTVDQECLLPRQSTKWPFKKRSCSTAKRCRHTQTWTGIRQMKCTERQNNTKTHIYTQIRSAIIFINKRLLRMPLHFLFLELCTVIFPLDLPDEIPFLFSLAGV